MPQATSTQPETPSQAAGEAAPARGDALLYSVLQILARLLATLLFNLRCRGIRNVPLTGGMLLVCSHQSVLDPVMYAVKLRRQISFFAKAELFENRWFGGFIRALHAFPVRRGETDVGAMREAIRRVKEGRALLIFPEGTRTRDGEIKRLEPGIGLMARRAGVPVVPAVIDGTFQAWKKGGKLPRPHPVRVLYGPPLNIDGLKPAEIIKLVESTLKSMLQTLREQNAR